MSVQRWAMRYPISMSGNGPYYGPSMDLEGGWVTYADHARIVAEAVQLARIDLAFDAAEAEYDMGYAAGKADAEQAHAAALAAARAEGFESAHNEWAKALPEHLRVDRMLRGPRTLTADENYKRGLTDAKAAVEGNRTYWQERFEDSDGNESMVGRRYGNYVDAHKADLDAISALIHDGEATP